MEQASGVQGQGGLRALFAVFAGSRLALVLVAFLAVRYFPLNVRNRDHNAAFAIPPAAGEPRREPPVAPDQAPPPESAHAEPSAISVWARWDALWYARIAERGYAATFDVDDLTSEHGEPPAAGFYPVMPLLMRALGPVFGSPLRAGLLIANLSLALSVWLLFRMTRRLLGDEAAWTAGTLLLVWPPGFFLSAPYADALGLALALLSLSLGLEGRFGWAGAAGFFAALTRPSGLLLAPALLVAWWSARRRSPGSVKWTGALAALLPAAGLGVFLVYCARAFGDPLAPIHRQAAWRGAMGWPPGVVAEIAAGPFSLLATRRSFVELAAALLFLALSVAAFRCLPPALALYGFGAMLLPLWTSLFSFSRLALAAFPAFMTAGALLRGRPALARGLVAFLAPLLAVVALLYFTWNWIG